MTAAFSVTRRRAVLLAALLPLAVTAPVAADQADFNEVGRQMAIMLQNGHFVRPPFARMSPRFLEHYLKLLDPGKVFFTRQDVDRFQNDYSSTLGNMLLKEESMKAADAIYAVYRSRVQARVVEAKRLLAENRFDFSGDATVPVSRKDAAWPANETEAMELWRRQVADVVLTETLRREFANDPAASASSSAAAAAPRNEMAVNEKIAARYDRLWRGVTSDLSADEIPSIFLSAVAQAFDPHTDYMNGSEMTRFYQEMRHQTIGIGASLQSETNGATRIRGLLVNGPADRQGKLKLGDDITAIDPDGDGPREMVDVSFMRIDKVVDLIRGPLNTAVTLKVEPAAGGSTELIPIMREEVPLQDQQASAQIVELKRAAGPGLKLGLMTLPSFYRDFEKPGGASCANDVEKLLTRMKTQSIDGLLFDIRGNGGGALTEVQRITGLFTPPAPVVQVKDGIGKIDVLKSDAKAPLFAGPLLVLTDRGSASASEIFAAALQDDRRAVIVGDSSTFGKGTVQTIREIGPQMPFFAARGNAGGLRLTVQKFYRPSGLATQNRGVVPDLVLPSLTDAWEQGESSLDEALEQDRIAAATGFHPDERNDLHLPELSARSGTRVSAAPDFADIREEAGKVKERIARNQLSLNLAARREEMRASTAATRRLEEQRKGRFAQMAAADRLQMTFYSVPLSDMPLQVIDPAEEAHPDMKMAPDRESDHVVKWPSHLDPQKRESMAILADLIDLNRSGAASSDGGTPDQMGG